MVGAVGPSLYATVVSRPDLDGTGLSPMLHSRKMPVPNVHLAVPGVRQRSPSSDAC